MPLSVRAALTPPICADDGIGRQVGFKNRCREACGFESRSAHHVGRSLLHSVSAVCVGAAKTAYPQAPSSFSPSNHASMGTPKCVLSSVGRAADF